jgi:hypothetical protein
MLVTFFVFQVLILPHSSSGQFPPTGSTVRHAKTAAWILSSVSGFAGVVEVEAEVDVGVAAAALVVVVDVLVEADVLAVGVAVAEGVAVAVAVFTTFLFACCWAMFGAVFGAAPGADGHPDG